MKQELALHQRCEELPLPYLTRAAIAEYLAERFPGSALPNHLVDPIHQRTDGNPLFMVNVVDAVVAQGFAVRTNGHWELQEEAGGIFQEVPETLRQMVERQLERLTPQECRVLEVASVAGIEFPAVTVAVGMDEGVVAIEEQCEELARQGHFIQPAGVQEWPDGTVTSRYRFIHALYQEVVYDRVVAARRISLHSQIGERLEAGYINRTAELAAELAMHFERGHDYQRAISYLYQAGKNATQRSANAEALAHFTKGLKLLKTLPDNRERVQHELMLQSALGRALMATQAMRPQTSASLCPRA